MHITIIAEAGVNHNGDISLAKEMVLKAKQAGADYVKFQTFVPENLVSRNACKAEYQKKNTDSEESQLDMLKKLALSYDDFKELWQYCLDTGIGFLSTPFDMESIDFLNTIEMDFWKIPSGEITNLPYLEKIGRTGKKVVLSTGMSDISEIQTAVEILEKSGCDSITLLHCNTEYPTPYEDVNLLAMNTIKKTFGKPVGYSDHTCGIEVPIAAAAMGASVIEKHFTLDRNMEGPDHKSSLDFSELCIMIASIRNIEKALGSAEKKPTESEIKNRNIARKSIVAKTDIKKGEIFSEKNLTVKRPGEGISPLSWYNVIGSSASRNYEEDELIEI